MPATVLLAFLLGLSALTWAQDPCDTGNHTILSDPRGQRSSNFAIQSGVQAICDNNLAPNWYRVQSPAGTLMPTACVQQFNCSTRLPVWLNGTYPSAAEGVVNRTACYSSETDCCRDPFTIQVLNCTSFVLFRLQSTSTCDSAYCFGDRTPCPDGFWSADGFEPGCEPQSLCDTGHYDILSDPRGQRSSNFAIQSGGQAICDNNLAPNWYRVLSPAGTLMPTACVQQFNCSTTLPVWLNGTYPSAAERVVNRTACYSSETDCCRDPFTIQVLNCTSFVLFRLQSTSTCDSAYCFGDRIPCADGFWSEDGFEPGCQLVPTTSSTIPPETSTNTADTQVVCGCLAIPVLTLHLWLVGRKFDP